VKNQSPPDAPTDSTTKGVPSFDQEKLDRAAQISLQGEEDPSFVAPPEKSPGGVSPSPGEDPALEGRGERPLEQRQEDWRGLALGVFSATGTTMEIFDVGATLTDAEVQQLASAWGDCLGHFYDIKDGSKKGDIADAASTSVMIGAKKLKQIKAKKETELDSGIDPPESDDTSD